MDIKRDLQQRSKERYQQEKAAARAHHANNPQNGQRQWSNRSYQQVGAGHHSNPPHASSGRSDCDSGHSTLHSATSINGNGNMQLRLPTPPVSTSTNSTNQGFCAPLQSKRSFGRANVPTRSGGSTPRNAGGLLKKPSGIARATPNQWNSDDKENQY